jgi:kynureninase
VNPRPGTATSIAAAVAMLGAGELSEDAIACHIAPLFSKVLAQNTHRIYLANHSLGRPLDATAYDVAEAVSSWQSLVGDAWTPWTAETHAYRERWARLVGSPRSDCIIPKTSAGQGLRAILNTYASRPRVLATRGEFDSLDVILRQYAHRGRIDLRWIEARGDGQFDAADLRRAIGEGVDLVVLSQVVFNTGQVLPELRDIVAGAHGAGASVLLDIYHSVGVVPVDLVTLDVDFAVGGAYKYLRGGPGACYLYIHPRHLDGSLQPLDVGWFAKRDAFAYERPDPPQWAAGGDAFLESTPPVLTYYQARAGQLFTEAMGVARLRAYSLMQQRQLVALLAERRIAASGGTKDRGAFVTVRHSQAKTLADALANRGVRCDARGEYLRLCPDVLTTHSELVSAAEQVGATMAILR